MARQPEVFVRALEPEEAQRLVQDHADGAGIGCGCAGRGSCWPRCRAAARRRRRAMFAATPQYAREVIHAFNEQGFAALDPKWSGGRPRGSAPSARELVCRVAKTPPQQLGRPFTTWSLSKLVEYLAAQHRHRDQHRDGAADPARGRDQLAGHQDLERPARTPTSPRRWPGSCDLYDRSPADGRVICVDEFGPLNLQPRPGRGWFPRGRPARLRATYTRTGGVRHMFAALDLATGQMFYRFRDRKRWQEFLGFLRQLRARFPTGRLYVVCDNFSPHKKSRGHRLVRRPRRRAGVHPEQRVLAELDRVRVHRAALLHPRRQRLPLPRRPGSRDRRLRPLGQQTRQTQAALRRRLQDPPTRLPTQRCLTRPSSPCRR